METATRLVELGADLDRDNLTAERGEQGDLVACPRADIEDSVAW